MDVKTESGEGVKNLDCVHPRLRHIRTCSHPGTSVPVYLKPKAPASVHFYVCFLGLHKSHLPMERLKYTEVASEG